MSDVRIGILGAARIAPAGVIRPAAHSTEASVEVVAARDPARAASFAKKHGIPRVAPDYRSVIEDPDINAIYNPLPNGLHAEWTLAAIAAGKHVLCEKPLTSNASEAEVVAGAAARSGLVVMEAFHYRYHPLARRAAQIVQEGQLGKLTHVEASLCFPLPKFSDIRYNFDLAGGAMMDAGCYPVSMVRMLGIEEPEVVSAKAQLQSEQVDRAMRAELRFPSGHTGRITASMWSTSLLKISAHAIGEHGSLTMLNPLAPQMWHRLTVTVDGKRRTEHFPRRHTYDYQLDAFCAAVLRGEPILTPPPDAVANMRVIDAVYRAAGLQPRGQVT